MLHEGAEHRAGRRQIDGSAEEVTVVICQSSVIKDTRRVAMCLCSPDTIFLSSDRNSYSDDDAPVFTHKCHNTRSKSL